MVARTDCAVELRSTGQPGAAVPTQLFPKTETLPKRDGEGPEVMCEGQEVTRTHGKRWPKHGRGGCRPAQRREHAGNHTFVPGMARACHFPFSGSELDCS
ncbi:hypothetical protein SBA1_770013 [Candidatus Sulfotelmatobacter kueseliae]|uniref:Uncharacterized protein n=1 Tax=Candidatus Sulfotelmatobacter kueseliae TaxID=2042962 RepID=A0A2U3L7L8_9BACT|nr:hypothetical protein SBA1_770013 [Candidatus Sulfotelmatobacter kueseliae]